MSSYINPARDPEKQARDWSELQIIDSPHVWLLGWGDGKHACELSARHPQLTITVIDHDKNLPKLNLTANIKVVKVEDEIEFISSPEFTNCAPSFSSVLEFRPYTQSRSQFYARIRQCLHGQTQESFSALARLMNCPFDFTNLETLEEINIKTVFPHLAEPNESAIMTNFRILRELVS